MKSPTLTNSTTAVAAGMEGDFACAINDGIVECWGANGSGQLGDGMTSDSATPVTAQFSSGVGNIAQVAAGALSACAVTVDGAVYCWGDNSSGELGNGSTLTSPIPVAVPTLTSGVTSVTVGGNFACALLSGGSVECWGNNTYGQLGDGTVMHSDVPHQVSGLTTGVTSVSAGWSTACAVAGGTIQCWGDNTSGVLGSSTTTAATSLVPVAVSGIEGGATEIAVGEYNACALVSGGAMCWGAGTGVGDGTSLFEANTPQPVTGLSTGVTNIAVGSFSGCAVQDGGVQCWGLNTAGQLGNNGAVNALSPVLEAGFP